MPSSASWSIAERHGAPLSVGPALSHDWKLSVYSQSSSTPLVFFFQAEDGIRDVAVTGVQTCALPISPWVERWTDITQVASPQFVVAIPEPEPMVTPRGVVMVIITIILTIAIVEVLFGGMINERMRKRRHRGFARRPVRTAG